MMSRVASPLATVWVAGSPTVERIDGAAWPDSWLTEASTPERGAVGPNRAFWACAAVP